MFGRRACDTKGSVAAMLTALCELGEAAERPTETEIIFAGLVDEENGQGGSRALVASRLKADLAIVGKPTRLQWQPRTKALCGYDWKPAAEWLTGHGRNWGAMRFTPWSA